METNNQGFIYCRYRIAYNITFVNDTKIHSELLISQFSMPNGSPYARFVSAKKSETVFMLALKTGLFKLCSELSIANSNLNTLTFSGGI